MPVWVSSPVHEKAVTVLVEARKAAGLTQRDLAVRLGKPPSFVAKIELRERNISLLEFVGLSLAIGHEPSEMLERITRGLSGAIEI